MGFSIRYDLLPAVKRRKPPAEVKHFGAIRTDHMFVAEYQDGGWRDPRIVPYDSFSVLPGAIGLHYGQTIFEGAKAFLHADGEIRTFRVNENAKRLNRSAETLMMPGIPEELQLEGLYRLLDVERRWCPVDPDASMYIRPFMFATEDKLGVKPSASYIYSIMLSPSGRYYSGGVRAVKLLVTTKFHRAVSGGTGAAKTGGNYAASLRAAEYAHRAGADQVLYLDASNTFIEEAGTMNHYHVTRDGVFMIPEFSDSILCSITSLSVLELAKGGICKAELAVIPIREFLEDLRTGRIIEAGGFGTAAGVSPVGAYIMDDGEEIKVGDGGIGGHSRNLYEYYTRIQKGETPAPEGWLAVVPRYPEAV
ncbi:MAG: branched-chain amino acid aminotransferase [Planctomycetes bacterium]|nr:branched-chain amino acid aminotransferase [Planctomycetota bacterium]